MRCLSRVFKKHEEKLTVDFITCDDSYRWFSHVTFTEVPPLAFKELINITIM